MNRVPAPGRSEQGFLADFTEVAERVGAEVLGYKIRWEVESTPEGTRKRPDVVVRVDETGQAIASGEAKRPDQPDGAHPLVTTNAKDAIAKAQHLGVPLAFTTNFFQVAVLESKPGPATVLQRVQGELIELVPESSATAPSWWANLTDGQRAALVESGLRELFRRVRRAQAAEAPPSADVNDLALDVMGRSTLVLVADLAPAIMAERDKGTLDDAVSSHAATVHLDLRKPAEARYLVAQGVAEVITAVLFYRNVQPHFSLPPLLAGTDPANSTVFAERVSRSLRDAKVKTGDYDTIFGLSAIALWTLRQGGTILSHWKNLFEFIDLLDFTSLTGEVMGAIFERLISPDRRREMGQHYTQSRLARSMSKWAASEENLTYADVSSGAGTFLVEVYVLLRQQGLDHVQALARIFGNDLDAFAVHLAAVNLATRDIYKGANYPAVRVGDAFDIRLGTELLHVSPDSGTEYTVSWPAGGIDRLIGNPPYDEGPGDEGAIRAALREIGGERNVIPDGMRGGNLAAWFVLLSIALLKPATGRFALVLPVGVLQNQNLLAFRIWLRRRFDLTIWHTEVDVWFSDARVATCVILGIPRESIEGKGRMVFVDVREPVKGALVERDGVPVPTEEVAVRDLSEVDESVDILVAGTLPLESVEFEALPGVSKLGEVPSLRIRYGNKLGHAAYSFTDKEPNADRVTRELEGHKTVVTLHKRYLTPLLSGPRDVRTGEFDGSHPAKWVLSPPIKIPTGGTLQDYIRHMRRLEVHKAPSVRSRGSAWHTVDWVAGHVALQLHPGLEHQVWWSDEPFVATNNFQTLHVDDPLDVEDLELIAASAASAFGALSAMHNSAEIGCEGVRYLTIDHTRDWPVLDPHKITDLNVRERVLESYRAFRTREAQKLHRLSEGGRSEFVSLTTAVAEAAGHPDPRDLAERAVSACEAVAARRAAREARALAGRTRVGRSGGSGIKRKLEAYLAEHPVSEDLLRALCAGPVELDLRIGGAAVQETLDFATGRFGAVTPEEEALARVLGEGFACAPDFDDPSLLPNAAAVIDDAIVFFLGEKPVDGHHTTYTSVSEEIRVLARKWLSRQVVHRLS